MPPSNSTPAPTPGDAEIVRLLRERDGSGLRLLLTCYGDRTSGGLKKSFGGSLTEIEIDEAMNTATYNAWRSAETYDADKGSLRAWFFVIARNAGLEILRERQRRRWEFRGDEMERMAETDAGEASSAPPQLFLDTLRRCIEDLPRLQRRIIEADLESGNIADAGELAKRLGTSKNSVYVSRSGARKSLRRALLQHGYAPGDGRSKLLWK